MKPKLGIKAYNSLSGGVIVILEHAYYLTLRNKYDVYLIFDNPIENSDLNWFDRAKELKKITFNEAQKINFDIVIATMWRSCYEIINLKSKHYLYFNQSVESKFYQNDPSKAALADATYLLGLPIITEATWIKHYLKDNFNIDAELAKNGINKKYFHINKEYKQNNNFRILIEGPLGVDFKNVDRTIEICKKSKAQEIWLLTSSDTKNINGIDKVFSKVPLNEVYKVYNQCDVLVKLSKVEGMFGPPLEMFHCGGTAITYNVTGFDEYMEHDHNSLIADMGDEDKILNYINYLAENPNELERLKANAIETASKWKDWEGASIDFETALEKSIQKNQCTQKELLAKSSIINNLYNNNIKSSEESKKTILLKKIFKKLTS